ncbi:MULTISPECIES: DUF6431 domain-containing protein [Acetivibrio]|uniref:DUF6431 domain-containing protein n=1 Tax=Acetivibrio TaxID=35829 RepID=UPI000486CE31|nr:MULTISPECIES: DUF6431 domain-containing protein [Acetivibrio]
MFFVRSEEQNSCPCCNGPLKVIGSRKRICINDKGQKMCLVIRRLRCAECRRIHHELPDKLVPYKRHVSESIEAVVTGESKLSIPADEATLGRWRHWFNNLADYFQGCLESIKIRYGNESVNDASLLPKSKLQRIWHHVGDAPGWLARIVRPIANLNLWPHTRFAFCP